MLIYTLAQAPAQQTNEYQATHYGTNYNGSSMGCGGVYNSNDHTILAVPPSLYHVPCGTAFQVTGPIGTIIVTRQDSCPGCDQYHMIDLSERGHELVCGVGTCTVQMTRLD